MRYILYFSALESLVDMLVTNEKLEASFLFNHRMMGVSSQRRPGRARAFIGLKRSEIHAAHAAARYHRALLLG
jgi:hypothetical protein